MGKLQTSFYRRDDVLQISRDLIGAILHTKTDDGHHTSGMIVETEAYRGYQDQANHAKNGNVTNRNRIMFEAGGVAYVYLCYGIHHLFNIVTNTSGIPDAVLIRAVKPLTGIDLMMQRRNVNRFIPKLTNGPGKLSQSLGIDRSLYGHSLQGSSVWIDERRTSLTDSDIASSKRIGIDYAGEDAQLPWRFTLTKEKKWVSK